MSKLRFTPIAEQDLIAILDYIGKERPLTARSVLARIRQKLELLATQPLMGQLVPERAADELHRLPMGDFLSPNFWRDPDYPRA
jgi:plasmid stabilization system protein ParE